MNFIKKLFGAKKEKEISQEEFDKDYELKSKGLTDILGPMHNLVGHAIIPFQIGGAVDMYYFPNHINGTGFATMELINIDGTGPKRNRIGTYELVGFTKLPYNENENNQNDFNAIERRFCGIFTTVGNYSFQAVLNPGETIEVPNETDENNCLILANYDPQNVGFRIGERNHHLMLCLEVFRSEMDFARSNGSDKLIDLLKQKGIYPYSDLNREPIV